MLQSSPAKRFRQSQPHAAFNTPEFLHEIGARVEQTILVLKKMKLKLT